MSTTPKTLPHYRVEVGRATGDWLTTPEYLGQVDRDQHMQQQETADVIYETYEHEDGGQPPTKTLWALTVIWKDPPVATNVPQFPAPNPETAAPPPANEVPQHIRAQLLAYAERYEPPGHFLGAVLRNDLAAAFQYGQPVDIAAVPAILAWLVMHGPKKCWGDVRAVADWMAKYDDGIPF